VAGTAGQPATPVSDPASATSVPSPAGTVAQPAGGAAPATVVHGETAATPAPQILPGLPELLGGGGVTSLLDQVHGVISNAGRGLVQPLASSSAATVTSTVGGLAHPLTAPAKPSLR
jgi:hypothetical protein